MRSDRRRLAAVLLLVAGAACPAQEEGGASLLVTFERSDNTFAAEALSVTWVGNGRVFGPERLAPVGGFPADQTVLGTFRIAVREPYSERTIIARAQVGEAIVAEGVKKVMARADAATDTTVTLYPGRLRDRDVDGIPDEVDNCPDEANKTQGACQQPPQGGQGGQAGMGGAGGTDGGAPDADLPDGAAPPPDARPDQGPPPDLGPSKSPRGSPCLASDECDTGRCADSRVGRFCASVGMLVVPAGAFMRGCLNKDPQCASDERPSRSVMVSAFEINITEVTQSQYDQCVKAAGACQAPSGFNPVARPNHPVANVTFAMANSYCAWAGQRLPTEAEWEKAARGPAGNVYPWSDAQPDCFKAQFRGCAPTDTVGVAQLEGTSGYGIEDMAGNVAEWVSDFYAANYYAGAPATDPRGPTSGMRTRRGGGFSSDGPALRTSARQAGDAASTSTGFRCARGL